MAKLECHFFPDTPASWICDSCRTHYSERCIPAGHSAHWGKQRPNCIRCNGALRYLGSATGAKPFWQMLPHFFVYPLHANSLTVIGLVAAGCVILGMNLLSLALVLFAVAVVTKYSFAIIEHRGAGDTRPPSVNAVITGDEHHLFLKLIAFMFLMGMAVAMASRLGELVGVLVAIFMTLATPASIMLLAVEKSVRRALNPMALMSLMVAVGWPYLLLWICVQIISAGPVYIVEWLAVALPESLILPFLAGLMVYFTFVLFAMLGYVLFEYQSELGFESVAELDDAMDGRDFEKARALGETTVLIRDSEYQRARECLRRALDIVRDDMELHQRYHKLLLLLDDDKALANHGEYLIELYRRHGQLAKGVSVLLDVHTRVPGFQLSTTQLALDLVPVLQAQGQHKAVLRLFHNLHKTRDRDPLVPAAYLIVARTFFEYLNDDAKALAIIDFVLKRYPQCSQRDAFEQLRHVITQQNLPGLPA